MVKNINSTSEFNSEIAKGCLTVVDFYADWCPPCRNIAPFLEDLAKKNADVNFLKVNVETCDEISKQRKISSMPTFQFFIKGEMIDEMIGADQIKLEQKVNEYKKRGDSSNQFGGKAFTLGNSNTENPPSNIRDARLNRFKDMESSKSSSIPKSSISSSSILAAEGIDDDDEEAIRKAIEMSLSDNSRDIPVPPQVIEETSQEMSDRESAEKEIDASQSEWDEEMVPLPVNEEYLAMLKEMGISDTRGRKGLHHGGSVEGAIDWINSNQDNPDIDQPYMVRKIDTIPKVPLTPAELAERQKKVQELIKKRKAEREKSEKAEEIKREKERRARGQDITETQEQRDKMMRKRENEKIKKEKEDAKREKAKLLAQIEMDKEVRRQNKGKLHSALGVEGYNPSVMNMNDNKLDVSNIESNTSSISVVAKQEEEIIKKTTSSLKMSNATIVDPEAQIDSGIQTIMRYRAGGDGGNALKLMILFIKNLVENPDEEKYRSINVESNAFKTKLAGLKGPMTIFKCLGFELNTDDGKLIISESNPLCQSTLVKLNKAAETYKLQNP